MVNPIYSLYYKPRNRTQKKKLRKQLAKELPKHGIGAEIGVYRGHHARTLVREAQPKTLYLIDPWRVGGPDGSLWGKSAMQESLEAYCSQVSYWAFHESLRNGSRIQIIRQPSPQAATQVPESLDWVYLDGDHRYNAVLLDLKTWYDKLKPGGVIYGDDYSARGWYGTQVQDAVHHVFNNRVEVHGKPGYQQWRVQKPC